jgi:hypothetical protein
VSKVHHVDADARDRLVARVEAALDRRSDLAFGVVFGSFLEDGGFHDIDVGIWTTESAGARVDLELAADLSEALGVPVDVRRLNDAPIPFLFHALRGRAVAVHDEMHLANLMERVAREYHDMAPLLRRAAREAFAG